MVTVDDRGPFVAGRDLDLSQGAAQAIGLDSVGEVEISEIPSASSESLPETGLAK